MTLVPVLLAGGMGTRLWPTSRASYPKQFVDLTGSDHSAFQCALNRAEHFPKAEPWIVVTNEEYRFIAAQQMRGMATVGSIILEPTSRGTAPAIALAAFEALKSHGECRLLIQTADHYIDDADSLGATVEYALTLPDPFILFGVEPTGPETGYGYIECGRKRGNHLAVSSFKEKPDRKTAQQFLKTKNYLWNSGMFLLNAEAYLQALEEHEPTVFQYCQSAFEASTKDLDFLRVALEWFENVPPISIDHAVIEKTKNTVVVPFKGDWLDLGSWDSLAKILEKDISDNAIQGDGVLLDSSNTFIRAESRLVTGIGLNNLAIVETRDAVLVVEISQSQNVKKIVEILNREERVEATEHPRMYRPWGHYETLDFGGRFRVKQITVDPGASLSLQMHHHRAEHWIVVSGTAEVQVGSTVQMLTEDESIYIPVGQKHRLANPGKIPLTVIEVQSGAYLEEDDIVRFADEYGRSE